MRSKSGQTRTVRVDKIGKKGMSSKINIILFFYNSNTITFVTIDN